MKVLFLDIDGVLNRDNTKEKIETVFGQFTGIDRKLLKAFLGWKKDRPEVQIVLSSSWRLDERYDHAFTKHLNELGIYWIDTTPNLGHRGEEVYQWYTNHGDVTHFAILDDMSDMHPVGKALIQTSSHKGLEQKHLDKIDVLLDLKKGTTMNDQIDQVVAGFQTPELTEEQKKAFEAKQAETVQDKEVTGIPAVI